MACTSHQDVQVISGSSGGAWRLETGGGWRRTCVWRERRWLNFIIWRWAGPAQDGWTPCLRKAPSPLPRHPRHPSTSQSPPEAAATLPGPVAAGGPLVARPGRPPARAGGPLARPAGPPSVRPERPRAKGVARHGSRRGRPSALLVSRPARPSAPLASLPGRPGAQLASPPVRPSVRLARAPARAGDPVGASDPPPARPGLRRS